MNTFNSVLSKNFIYSNLKYNEDGLFYVNKSKCNQDEIFITDDRDKILSLLGLDSKEVEACMREDFFNIVSKNKMFRLSKFLKVKEKTSDDLKEFARFLDENNVEPKGFKPVHMSEFSNINPNFHNLLKDSNLWLSGGPSSKTKFNGKTIKAYFPDYDMTTLSTTMPMFINSFGSTKEYQLFLLKSSNEEIHEYFQEVTNKFA